MFDRDVKFRVKVIILGLYLIADYFGLVPHRRSRASMFEGEPFALGIGLGLLLLGGLIYALDGETIPKIRKYFPFRFSLPFQFTAGHALLALGLAFAALIVIELFFEKVSLSFLLLLLLAGGIPAVIVLLRRLGLSAGMNTGSTLARDLAKKMPGRSSADMASGALAAMAALCDMLDNQRKLGTHEIVRRIQNAFPDVREAWLRDCIELTEASNIEPQHDLISLAEFYANLLASQSKAPLARLRIVDWSLGLLYTILFEDGIITRQENETFSAIAGHFGIGSSKLHEIKRRARFGANDGARFTSGERTTGEKSSRGHGSGRSASETGLPEDVKAALALFNLKQDFSPELLEKEWRRILKSSHPDRFHFTSPDLYRQAHERFLKFSAAYELLKSQRP